MADLQAELRAIRGGRLGKVRAGLGPVPAKLVLAPSMERFVRDGMGIEISTEIGSTSDLALKVARGELDFRSEEHTSELQSLMRISYAVFCLKKKIQTRHRT